MPIDNQKSTIKNRQSKMDIVLDIGNSAVKGALFAQGGELERAFRLDLTPASASRADWQQALRDAVTPTPERAGVSSVVPTAAEHARAALRAGWGLTDAFAVRADAKDVHLPFELGYRTPATLGADRLAAAAAAWLRYGKDNDPGKDNDSRAARSVVALDAGTALTYEVVRADAEGGGVYEGGAIAPGPALLRRTLASDAAQLPSVPLGALPPSPIGSSTQNALQSGLLYGLIDSADGMIRRLTDTLPDAPVVVATGGWSHFLREHLPDRIPQHAPHLVLRGVHALMRLNERGSAGERERG
jgi:type III pantothenate kinase